ncbi:GUN4 domain-containing protein [Oscillatoria sp. HE19RPO]|uniref:GUN4 domain-containing protein n=1 Tax=Oscillatoria sp. HE19RPO TaxID=2954806 RepID=UPI0020C475F6|nr:GUN4 domain-containing protein [Oscillatoria sp. HE19RPO]
MRKEAQLKSAVQVLEVEPLNFKQIQQFVSNWYREVECIRRGGQNDLGTKDAAYRNTEDLLNQVKERQALRDLASNPLLLTLIVTAHQQNQSIPLKRVELYQTICEVMLGKRQEAKGIRSQLSIQEKLCVLQPLALELMQRQTRQFQLSEVETLFTAHLAKLPNPPETVDFLKQLQAVDALIAKEREGDYEFAHLSFQEYLAAVEVKETQQEEIFLKVLQDPNQLSWWAETMRLYAAQTDATQLVEAIVQESKTLQQPDFKKLFLAWDFCNQGRVRPIAKQGLSTYTNEPLKVLDAKDYEYAVSKQPCYFKLAYFLQTRQWKEADTEIFPVIRRTLSIFLSSDIKHLPYSDLRIIDQLWLKYSNGHFGLSLQKQIWMEVGGKLDYAEDFNAAYESYIKLSEQLEWRKDGKWVHYNDLVWDLSLAPKAHLPHCGAVRFSRTRTGPLIGLGAFLLSRPDL